MVAADARALLPELQLFNNKPGQEARLLTKLAHWCIRFTPVAAVDLPDGLLLDISGCAHLWGTEAAYLETILAKLKAAGYTARGAIADTVGAAWALARYGAEQWIAPPAAHWQDLLSLPPAALRLEAEVLERMKNWGSAPLASWMRFHAPCCAGVLGNDYCTGWNRRQASLRNGSNP